ncbi:MAG: hypothetical protein PHR30_02580 [Gallionellaceae bacterium]|nr:hypothetical protein [Gallionellaceae bacterium]
MPRNHRPLLLAAALLLAMVQGPLRAAPSGPAGAHDGRLGHYYMGYTGRSWDADYGITRGKCHRAAVAAALGDGHKVAIAVVAKDAPGIDPADAACIGHALELTRVRHRVTWQGEGGVRYQVRPLAPSVHDGLPCREFELVTGNKRVRQSACLREPGIWQLR